MNDPEIRHTTASLLPGAGQTVLNAQSYRICNSKFLAPEVGVSNGTADAGTLLRLPTF